MPQSQFYHKGAFRGIDLPMLLMSPRNAIVDFDNFTQLQVTDGNTLGGYISTADAGGTLIQEFQDPGIALQIGTDGDDNDGSFLGRQTAVGAFDVSLNSNRRVAFESRFKVVQGAEVAIFVGLAEAGLDQDLIVDSTGAIADKDVIGFHCLMHATDVDIDGIYRIEGGDKVVGSENMSEDADDAFHTYGFQFDGAKTLYWFYDYKQIGESTLVAAEFADGQALTPTFAVKTGEAVEKDLTVWSWQAAQLLLESD